MTDNTVLYSPFYNIKNFKLFKYFININEGHSININTHQINRAVLLKQWMNLFHNECDSKDTIFYLSYILIYHTDLLHRRHIDKVTNPNTINLDYVVKTTKEYFEDTLKKILEIPTNEKGELMDNLTPPSTEDLQDILEKSFSWLRTRFGFSENNPNAFTYHISTEAKAAATKNSKCEEYLKQLGAQKFLSISTYDKICKKLNEEFQEDAKRVIHELDMTKNRNHLAAFSINAEADKIYICAANNEKSYIKMEAWKFTQLIESNNEVFILCNFDDLKQINHTTRFKFNNNNNGEILGKLDKDNYCLTIVCHKGKSNKGADDMAHFFIDFEYTMCMYVMLKRLEEDKYKFERFIKKINQTTSGLDFFEKPPTTIL